jgi:predicted nucleotidyltransferase
MIASNDTFKRFQGAIFSSLIGGSKLYGLDTEESDTDYRGIFLATSPLFNSGLDKIESIVINEPDATYYELLRYFQLLRKSNTQALEILFAPDWAFIKKSKWHDVLVENKERLINSHVLSHSLKGYFHSEMKLATGERTGRLGGKRKGKVDQYGFSPKNFVQMIRLCYVGIHFFQSGEFRVHLRDHNPALTSILVDVKTEPEKWSKEKLTNWANESYKLLEEAINNTKVKWEFDPDLAAELILAIRAEFS